MQTARMVESLTLLCFLAAQAAMSAQPPRAERDKWRLLFDGRSTDGWVPARPRGQRPHPWKVIDGALTNSADIGMDLCTEEEFADYELQLEYRLPPADGNSGVFLRGQVEVQLRGPGRGLGAEGSGAIFGLSPPRSAPQRPPGAWNRLRVVHVGDRVSVWINGVLVQDRVVVDTHTAATMLESVARNRKGEPLDLARGPIMLQGDRSAVWFRDIRIREIETEP